MKDSASATAERKAVAYWYELARIVSPGFTDRLALDLARVASGSRYTDSTIRKCAQESRPGMLDRVEASLPLRDAEGAKGAVAHRPELLELLERACSLGAASDAVAAYREYLRKKSRRP